MQEEKSSLKSSWRSRILGKTAKLLYIGTSVLAIMNTVSAEGSGIQGLTESITTSLNAVGGLMIAVAAALLAAGIIFKFLPWGSQRMKEAGGQLLDHALLLGGIAAIGIYLILFAAQIAVAIVGQGEVPSVSGPWSLSS